ncbi:MAG TPA: MFS transporter [Steroidobacteraceae bacterium]|nr:MFS transporter [Steroidobacteraceae bacterium]
MSALAASSPPWPSGRVAYYTLLVLVLCLTSSQLDVAIVPYLAASIKSDLELSDTSLGLLFGLSFGLFYTLVGLPIAYFVDRFSRRWILALGIATWNIGTALCGLAQSFTQLFIARFLVGAGEGVNGPTSYSITADLFAREKMPRAVAVLQLGSVIGPAIALLFGAWLLHAFLGIQPIRVPFGMIHGWQLIFILLGAPSVLIAVLILATVPEPARRFIPNQMARFPGVSPVPGSGLSAWLQDYGAALGYMRLRWTVFAPLFGSLLASSFNLGALQWGPIFYQRTYGWGPAKLAGLQAIAQLLIVPLGLLASVMLAEYFSRRRRNDAAMRVYVIARLLALPGIFNVLMPTPWLAFGLGTIGFLTIGMAGTAQNAALQIVTPAELRGKVTALYLFIYAVVGVALAPLVNALITDYVLRDESLIRWGIFWPTVIGGPLSLLIAWLGVVPYGREVARLQGLEA